MTDCLVCPVFGVEHPRTPRAGYTCGPCLQILRQHLADLPALYVYAAAELLPGAGGEGRGSSPSIGLSVVALDLRNGTDLLDVLAGWARLFREDYALVDWIEPHPPSSDPTGWALVETCSYLDRHLASITESHPAVDEFARELHAVHRQALVAARRVPRQAWIVSCPRDVEDDELGRVRCGRKIRVTGEDFGSWVICKGCGTGWDVTRLLHVVASDKASTLWLPAGDIAMLYGLTERTLQRWAKDGLVERDHGRYDLETVRTAMLKRRKEA